ncbi:MAG: small multi-drug export protein [Treponema sp.]|nr:small multi-drug export protein [Treponema sp.]MCR5621528.1 small multi-drug export protein [Treponema sp.]
MLIKYLIVFFISMIPLIELRGAIPVAAAWGLMPTDNLPRLVATYALCIVGNMIPVPIIYLFARKFLEWGQDKKFIGGICQFFLTKGTKAGQKLEAKAGKGLFIALLLFVGIPLPGTGAWTGTLGASLLDMKFKPTVLAVMGGVLLAGIIMLLASLGVLGAAGAVLG